MNEPRVLIRFDGNGRAYFPGEALAGECRLDGVPLDEVEAIEISTLWYTEGKGDEDMAVHDFRRLSPETDVPEQPWPDLRRPVRFSTVLPNSPLSYHGAIFKIRWCVRVRVFLADREVLGQREFKLGNVPAPQLSADSTIAIGDSNLTARLPRPPKDDSDDDGRPKADVPRATRTRRAVVA